LHDWRVCNRHVVTRGGVKRLQIPERDDTVTA
jgi:hypothetical protein